MGNLRCGGHNKGKNTIEEMLYIDINQHKQYFNKTFINSWYYKGIFKASIKFTLSKKILKFSCKIRDIQKIGKINIDYTKCNYGNTRPWFICPVCKKRYAILYFNNHSFYCRKCLNLNYKSSQLSKNDNLTRLATKLKKIENKLNLIDIPVFVFEKPKYTSWEEYFYSILQLKLMRLKDIKKPKHIHYKTFNKLKNNIETNINNIESRKIYYDSNVINDENNDYIWFDKFESIIEEI